ncbi:hypothetical protein [Peribacillus frigoritolerans]|uniref:hypothetical protein n=1 Tax=Peribacillus frigoritolerans TaxID=450367 RepID=UPI001070CE0F|nr:hypothetical protein [Peribacillus frigoritolerans]TFH59648.1 hypothetical protein E4J71_19720 [Peribacillus frigoritolerans]
MEQLNKEEIRFTLHTWKAQGEVLGIPLFNSIGHTVFPSSKEEDTVSFRTIDYWTRSNELSPADTIIQKSGLMKAEAQLKNILKI